MAGLNLPSTMTEQDHDDEDVPAALTRVTQDGPGTDDLSSLPESDFVSFDTKGVEVEPS